MTSVAPLTWQQLGALAAPGPDTVHGPNSPQALLRLFGGEDPAVRVVLYRDHHAWCPYCQRIWLWLEEKRVPYRIRKVSMVCYGEKEPWYRQLVPSGLLPALELDGQLLTESDRILEALENTFGPLHRGLQDPEVQPLRQLERRLFRAWCRWLCMPGQADGEEQRAAAWFAHIAETVEAAIAASGGECLLAELSGVDLIFAPFLERMNASLAYYKGYRLRQHHPAIDRWLAALEQRSTYRGTQGDFHTHAHDLPPQMGCCVANGTHEQRQLAERIDQGPWPLDDRPGRDPESRCAEPDDAAAIALSRMLRHRQTLIQRHGTTESGAFDEALRCALTHLAIQQPCPPPGGTAGALRSLAQRISVPRDMPLHSARRLRQSLQTTARLDPVSPQAPAEPLPLAHRLDQNPAPFLEARRRLTA